MVRMIAGKGVKVTQGEKAESEENDGGISPFQALALSLASRVGVGAIAGVATGIAFGGPGAMFWMAVTGLLGAASSYAESLLAQVYKRRIDGEHRGGIPYYIKYGLRIGWLAAVAAVIAFAGYGFLFPGIQSNNISSSVEHAFNVSPWITATIVTIVVLAYALLVFPQTRLHQTVTDAGWTSVFLANWHLAASGTDYFSTAEPSMFQHYWSLAVEEQFYIVWPILVMLIVPRFGRRGFLAVSSAVVVLSLGYSIWSTGAFPEATYFNTGARAFELAAGSVLACALRAPIASRWRHLAGLGGLAILVYATVAFTDATPFPGWHALVPVVGSALLLAAGPATPTGRLFSWAPLRYIGDISFSLYLWHWPVALAVQAALPEGPLWLTALLTVAMSLVLSALSYRFIEKTFQAWRLPKLRTLWFWPVSVGLVCAVALSAGMLGDARFRAQQAQAEAYFDEHGYQQVDGDNVDDVQDTLDEAVDIAESGAPIPPAAPIRIRCP